MNTRNEIIAELQEISPVLLGLKKAEQKPAVPEGYFDQLGSTVIARACEEPGLSVLAGLDKKQVSDLPGQYFENLGDQVMEKIRLQEQETGRGRIISPKRHTTIIYLRRLAVAASLAGVILLGVKLFQRSDMPVDDCPDGFACLTREEIRQYVNDNIDEFEAEQIHEAFPVSVEISTVEMTVLPEETIPAQPLDENKIEQYIKENPATNDLLEDASTDIF